MKLLSIMNYKHRNALHSGMRKFLQTWGRENLSTQNSAVVKTVTINTCESLYKRWKTEKKFTNIPNSLRFEINYADYCSNLSSNQVKIPTIVALHGAPGSHEDFKELASYLHSKGTRVIIPSFPDFSSFPPGIFRHSAEEKAEYIKDFLSALSVKTVDTLIVHSSAVFPGLILSLENSTVIVKSLVMLCPGTHDLTNLRSMKHQNVLRFLVKYSENPLAFKVLMSLGPLILKAIKIPVRVESFLDPLLSSTCMINADVPKSRDRFKQLSEQDFPMLYAFSDDDKLIGKEPSYDLAHLLGVSDCDIYIFDKEGNMKQEGKETKSMKVLSFENGSHYVFWKHSDIIKEAIVNFMQKHKFIEL